MARVNPFQFTKSWRKDEGVPYFPTKESSETKVRADLQQLFNEIKSFINETLLDAVNTVDSSDVSVASGAGTVMLSDKLAEIDEALEDLDTAIEEATVGTLPDDSITGAKIQHGTLTGAHLDQGTIDQINLANGCVSTTELNDLAVTEAKLANNAVTTAKILDGSVTGAKIAPGGLFEDTSSSASYELVVGTGRVSPTGGSIEYVRVCPGLKMVFFAFQQPVQIFANTYEIVHFDLQNFPGLTDSTMMDVCVTVENPEGEIGAGLPASGFDGWHARSRGAKIIWVEKNDAYGGPNVATSNYDGVFKVTGSYAYSDTATAEEE